MLIINTQIYTLVEPQTKSEPTAMRGRWYTRRTPGPDAGTASCVETHLHRALVFVAQRRRIQQLFFRQRQQTRLPAHTHTVITFRHGACQLWNPCRGATSLGSWMDRWMDGCVKLP
jgi:hypothetical protein